MEEGGVRVATLNLWGRNGAWEERRSVLIEGLLELQPDLIAFQEAIVGDGNHGASIASRWPIGEVR